MTKISKFILFFFVSLCLACLIASQVSAKEYSGRLWGTNTTASLNSTISLSSDYNNYTINITTPFNANGYDTILGNWYGYYTNTTINTNIDLKMTCQNTGWIGQPYRATITYADGSTATIDYTDYEEMCQQYTSNNSTYSTENFTNEIQFSMYIQYSNGATYNCKVSSSNYECPVVENLNISKLLLYVSKKSNVIHNFKVGIMPAYTLIKEDVTSIIDNQTQNTNSINNNITNLNDNITSDNITGNNSSDSISSISNTFSSSNDFILNLFTLPYNFITTIMNGVSNSCTPISLGTIFDYELVMPCINLNNWLGDVWTTIIDVVLAGMLSFAFRKRIHDFFFAIIRLDRNAANIGGVEIL